MSDIKAVVALLCKHLNLSIGSSFKPEYLRSAKYNKGDEDAVQALWTALYLLSRHAVKDQKMLVDFDRYDDLHATKLHFALLRYPTADFYALSKKTTSSSRELLLALGWLIGTKHALNIAVREKITSSVLGQEYSCTEDSPDSSSIGPREKIDVNGSLVDAKLRMNNIAHTCGRVGHNVKEIAELLQEKITLTSKIHGATLNISGLPHLSVSQVAMTKKMFTRERKDFRKTDEESLKELHSLAALLETHRQWTKAQHVFYDWMVTVVAESRGDKCSPTAEDRTEELSKFLSLLRHVTKKKLHSLKTSEPAKSDEAVLYGDSCASRFFRTHQEDTEAELWCSDTKEKLRTVEDNVRAKMEQLTSELGEMLTSISNCVDI